MLDSLKTTRFVTLGVDLHPFINKAIAQTAFEIEFRADPMEFHMSSTIDVQPQFTQNNLHTANFTSAFSLRNQMAKELSNRSGFSAQLGDFFPSARHEVISGLKDGTSINLAVTSSWPGFFASPEGVCKARYLGNIFTLNSFDGMRTRGLGLGTQLMQNLEIFAKEKGEKYIFLITFARRKSFFEQMGYVVNRTMAAEIMMVKKLFAFALPLLALGGLYKSLDAQNG